MAIRVVTKEDKQRLGRLFDELRRLKGGGFISEELDGLFFDQLDDWFDLINRPPVHVFDGELAALEATRT